MSHRAHYRRLRIEGEMAAQARAEAERSESERAWQAIMAERIAAPDPPRREPVRRERPPVAPIERMPDLATQLAAVSGNDDRAKIKRATIRAEFLKREIEG